MSKRKMQGAARGKGDLNHTPKHRAGEKREWRVGQKPEGAMVQLETATALKNGSRRKGREP